MTPKFSRMLSTHLFDTCTLCLCSTCHCLMCLKGSSEICVRPAEPDPDIGRTPTREHYSHQHHGVAGTGVGFSFRGTLRLMSSPIWLSPCHQLYFQPWKVMVENKTCLSCVILQYVAELLHEQAQPIVSTCSVADVQAAFNTIVTRIQRLWVIAFKTFIFQVYLWWLIAREFQEIFTQTLRVFFVPGFLSLPQFSSIFGSIHLPRPSNVC